MNAVLILNDQAGNSSKAGNDPLTPVEAHDALAGAGIHALVVRVAGAAIESAVAEAVERRPDAVIVGGGDGTVSTAARRLVDTGVALAVLPLGTLNHFAHDLAMPLAWRDAVQAIATGTRRAVDVAEVNGRVFINNCSIGAYAEAVHRRDALRRNRGHGKWAAMLMASLTVFRELRRHRVQIETAESDVKLRTPLVLISNNRYTGQVLDARLRPRLDEGRMWIYTTRARRHFDVLRMAWQTLFRSLDSADALQSWSTSAAVITTTPGRLPIAADGEVLSLASPLRFRIRPGALQVIAPVPPVAP